MYVRFHPEADEELVEAQDWYDKQSESKHRCADRSEHRFVLKRVP